MAKFKRIVSNIEKCFKVYAEERQVDALSFHQIKNWYNSQDKNGISSARLINLLRKRPQFIWQYTERKVGSNETVSYWSLGQKSILPNPAEGWVVVEQNDAVVVHVAESDILI